MRVRAIAIAGAATIAISAVSAAAGASTVPPTEPPWHVIGVADTTAPVGTIPDPAACAEGLTLDDGVLTVATGEPAFPPYVIDDDPTTGEGFEAAVAYAVAGQLGFAEEECRVGSHRRSTRRSSRGRRTSTSTFNSSRSPKNASRSCRSACRTTRAPRRSSPTPTRRPSEPRRWPSSKRCVSASPQGRPAWLWSRRSSSPTRTPRCSTPTPMLFKRCRPSRSMASSWTCRLPCSLRPLRSTVASSSGSSPPSTPPPAKTGDFCSRRTTRSSSASTMPSSTP